MVADSAVDARSGFSTREKRVLTLGRKRRVHGAWPIVETTTEHAVVVTGELLLLFPQLCLEANVAVGVAARELVLLSMQAVRLHAY